jgi:hypothetical protein
VRRDHLTKKLDWIQVSSSAFRPEQHITFNLIRFTIVESDNRELPRGDRCAPSDPVRLGERQHFTRGAPNYLLDNQRCSLLRQLAAENTSDVEQRATATHHADVMRAVADYIALGTQDSVLQRDGIETRERCTDDLSTEPLITVPQEKLRLILSTFLRACSADASSSSHSLRRADLFFHCSNPRTFRRFSA